MRILVDINHPAHVHVFKHFIVNAKEKGHEILVTASRKDISLELLREYGIPYIDMGSYGKGLLRKAINVPIKDFAMLRAAREFQPDVMIGLASHRICHVGALLGIRTCVFDDTEHASLEIMLYRPFVDEIYTPSCFERELGKKQVRYPGYHELAYLHPNRFAPDPKILKEIGVSLDERYTVVRFVSWDATHDKGHRGIGLERQRRAIAEFEKFGKVFVSSEKPLPPDLEKYRLAISPGKAHHIMAYAALIYGESATMASEAAVLGVHAIFCDFFGRGYTNEEEARYGLVANFRLDPASVDRSIEKAKEWLADPDIREKAKTKQKILLREKVDTTSFMLDRVLSSV